MAPIVFTPDKVLEQLEDELYDVFGKNYNEGASNKE